MGPVRPHANYPRYRLRRSRHDSPRWIAAWIHGSAGGIVQSNRGFAAFSVEGITAVDSFRPDSIPERLWRRLRPRRACRWRVVAGRSRGHGRADLAEPLPEGRRVMQEEDLVPGPSGM